MTSEKTQILTGSQINQKLERIAYEILEDNYTEKMIYLGGINVKGLMIANKLKPLLESIEKIDVKILPIKVNAANPVEHEVQVELGNWIDDKVVIIIDDVANTGRTIMFAIKPFLEYLPKKIQCAVLVDREHKTYPIQTDYKGMSLATTLQEHIDVDVSEGEFTSAYLE